MGTVKKILVKLKRRPSKEARTGGVHDRRFGRSKSSQRASVESEAARLGSGFGGF